MAVGKVSFKQVKPTNVPWENVSQVFSLERKAKEQEREAKLGERELGELRSSNQYLLERLEQVTCCLIIEQVACFLII